MPSVFSWFTRRRPDSTAGNSPSFRSDHYDYLPGSMQNDASKKNPRLAPFSGIDRDWIAFFIFDLVGAEVPK
ncbi:hypothetical protein BGZ58_007186, partial [Dissophora ornata]